MESFPNDIIVDNILIKYPFTFTITYVNKHFIIVQNKYYERMGCTNDESKKFMLNLIKIYNSFYPYAPKIYCDYYEQSMVIFNSIELTKRMYWNLETFVEFTKQKYNIDNCNMRTQIILQIAEKMIVKKNFRQEQIVRYLLSYTKYMAINENFDFIKSQNKKEILKYNINLVNKFYEMIGLDRVYHLEYEYYKECKLCDSRDCRCGYRNYIMCEKYKIIPKIINKC